MDITAGGDFLGLCDQKSSYKHVSDFGWLWSCDRLKLRIEGNDYTSQHDFVVKYKIGYFNGNRCPESENDVSFFISRLVVAQFCFF